MRNAIKASVAAIGLSMLAACEQDRSDQNIVIDSNNLAADIEMLPADESSATPTDQLENGEIETNSATNDAGSNSL